MTVPAPVRPARSTAWVPSALVALIVAGIVLGVAAIRRGDVARHRVWMTRAYALALGAGTQTFTLALGGAAFGIDLMLGAGWVINLVVAEYVVRRIGFP